MGVQHVGEPHDDATRLREASGFDEIEGVGVTDAIVDQQSQHAALGARHATLSPSAYSGRVAGAGAGARRVFCSNCASRAPLRQRSYFSSVRLRARTAIARRSSGWRSRRAISPARRVPIARSLLSTR